jgi:MFS family permease
MTSRSVRILDTRGRCATSAWPTRDTLASAGAIVLFSFALGISNLALPLVALAAGYSAAQVGLLTGISAVAQLLVRATIPALSRRFADRSLVSASAGLIAGSCAIVAVSTAVVPFAVAELLQGAARGYFWSGSQLHAVRTSGSALKGIARMNLLSSAGFLVGPITAGALAGHSHVAALVLAAVVAGLGTCVALLMTRLPILGGALEAGAERLWRRPAVIRASVASAGGGAWNALVVSYVPIILAAEQPPVMVGLLVAAANGANVMASAAVALIRPDRVGGWLVAATVANGLGLALVAPAAPYALMAAGALVVCGLGSGMLLTLGPALATEVVSDDQRAGAIAVTGASRAAGMLVTPLAVAAAVTVMPLAAAMAVTGCVLSVPFRIRKTT